MLQVFRSLMVEKVPSNNWQQACMILNKICFILIMQMQVVACAVLLTHLSSISSPLRAAAAFGTSEPQSVLDHSMSQQRSSLLPQDRPTLEVSDIRRNYYNLTKK